MTTWWIMVISQNLNLFNPRNNALKSIQEFYLARKDYPYPLLRKSDRIVSKAKREAYARAKTIGYL